MSWTVDGHIYHNYSDYQAALQRKLARESDERTGLARAEAQRYQQRLREQQQALEQAQGDLARQRGINEQMRQEVRGLEREQRDLADAQARFEQESTARLGELRSHMQGMDAQLGEAEAEHRRHVEATRRNFEQARQALQAGLADAERQRQEGERRLTAAVAEVDRKVELDRQARLHRQRNDLDQAREQIAMVEEVLGQFGARLAPLNLEEDEHSVRMELQSAQRMLKAGKASPALTQAESAFSGARALGYKSQKRRSELAAANEAVANRVEAVREVIAAEALDTYFKTEKAELVRHLAQITGRLPQRYQKYSRMEDDLREDERIVGKLEEEARAMVAMCPTLAEQVAQRKTRITEVVRKAARSYGGSADIRSELEDPDDLKSALVVNCIFSGGAKVRIVAGVDGGYHVDAAGHGSQDECNRRAAEFVQMLGAETRITDHRTLASNPGELPDRVAAKQPSSWREVGTRLREIGKQF